MIDLQAVALSALCKSACKARFIVSHVNQGAATLRFVYTNSPGIQSESQLYMYNERNTIIAIVVITGRKSKLEVFCGIKYFKRQKKVKHDNYFTSPRLSEHNQN